MKTERRIQEYDALLGRLSMDELRKDDKPALAKLLAREILRLERLVNVADARKAQRLQAKPAVKGAVAEPETFSGYPQHE